MTLEELKVLITAETSGLKKELNVVKSQLNTAGQHVKASTETMKKGFMTLGKVAAAAFAVKTVVNFASASIKAASELESALLGLRSIVEGQGRSFYKAQSFINEYISDGLVPLADAVTAYKNLAARGYDDEQIQIVMTRLKDAAAFGRQSSYTLGQAVKSATEGLKNENSVLVDNAGVTKNVAKMWDEYAKSIGKSANQLTQQEKIMAEVNGIVQETQFQVGDAAKYSDTYAGRLAALNKTLYDIKVNLGNAFMPIVNTVLPLLQQLANAVSSITSQIAAFSQAIFGKAHINSTKQQAAAITDLGNAAEKAGKQAKSLAGFDELNLISTSSGSGSVDEEAPVTVFSDEDAKNAEAPVSKLKQAFESFFSFIKDNPAIQQFKDNMSSAFNNIAENLIDFKNTTLTDMYNYIVNDYLANIGIALYENLLPTMLGVYEGAAQITSDIVSLATSTWDNIWQVIKPGLDLAKEVITGALEVIKELWDKYGKQTVDNVRAAIKNIQDLFQKIWDNIIKPILIPALEEMKRLWNDHIKGFVQQVGEFVLKLYNAGLEIYNGFVKPIITWLVEKLGPIVSTVVSGLIKNVGSFIGAIYDAAKGIFETLGGIIDFISGVFSGNWKKAWEGVKNIFKGVWDTFLSIVKIPLNGIIGGVNLLIKGLNSIHFDIPDWVPFVGGQKFGITIPEIPRLAQGGYLAANNPRLIIGGDNPREGEIIAPESKIYEQTYRAVRDAIGSNGNSNREIVIKIGDIALARLIIDTLTGYVKQYGELPIPI